IVARWFGSPKDWRPTWRLSDLGGPRLRRSGHAESAETPPVTQRDGQIVEATRYRATGRASGAACDRRWYCRAALFAHRRTTGRPSAPFSRGDQAASGRNRRDRNSDRPASAAKPDYRGREPGQPGPLALGQGYQRASGIHFKGHHYARRWTRPDYGP